MVFAISHRFFNYRKILIFLLIIFGVDIVMAADEDYDARAEIFDFAINSVLPVIVLIIYNSNKFFDSPYYYFYTNAFLLFVTPFVYPFVLFRTKEDIITPLWIQIFYAVIGLLKFISTFGFVYTPGSIIKQYKYEPTILGCFFSFFKSIAPCWLMLIPQIALIITFWEPISITIGYPSISVGFVIEVFILYRSFQEVPLTFSVGFIMLVNQAILLITVYVDNSYISKTLLALTLLSMNRVYLDEKEEGEEKKGPRPNDPFKWFLTDIYRAFDCHGKDSKIVKFIESHAYIRPKPERELSKDIGPEDKGGEEKEGDNGSELKEVVQHSNQFITAKSRFITSSEPVEPITIEKFAPIESFSSYNYLDGPGTRSQHIVVPPTTTNEKKDEESEEKEEPAKSPEESTQVIEIEQIQEQSKDEESVNANEIGPEEKEEPTPPKSEESVQEYQNDQTTNDQ